MTKRPGTDSKGSPGLQNAGQFPSPESPIRRLPPWLYAVGAAVVLVTIIGGIWVARGARVKKPDPKVYQRGHNPLIETKGPSCVGIPLGARRIVYCIDSGSALTESFDVLRGAVLHSMNSLEARQQFGLVAWGTSKPSVIPPADVTPVHRKAFSERLEEVQPGGSSKATPGIRAAIEMAPDLICLIAAKGPSEAEAATLAAECRRAGIVVHCLAIRDDIPTLSVLAEKTRGAYQLVDPTDLKTWLSELR